MTWLILRGILLLLTIFTALIGNSKLAGTPVRAPLLVGTGNSADLTTVSLTDMQTGITATLRYAWAFETWSADRCSLAAISNDAAPVVDTLNLVNGQRTEYRLPGMSRFNRSGGLIAWSPDQRWLALQYPRNRTNPLVIIDTLSAEIYPVDDHFQAGWLGWIDPVRFQYQSGDPGKIYTYNMDTRAVQPGSIDTLPWYQRWNTTYILPDGAQAQLFDAASTTTLRRFPNFWQEALMQTAPRELSPNQAHLALTELFPGENQQLPSIFHFAAATRSTLPPLNAAYKPVLNWSPDSSKLAYQAATPELNRRDDILVMAGSSGEQLFRVPTLTIVETIWSPDSRYLVIRGADLRLLDTHTGQIMAWAYPSSGYRSRILWSPDSAWLGVRLAGTAGDFAMAILNIHDGQLQTAAMYANVTDNAGFCFPA